MSADFSIIQPDDTAKTLYERVEEASVAHFRDVLPRIVSGDVHDMRTLQSKFDGPRHHYNTGQPERRKDIDPDLLTDPDQATRAYDRIRAVEFPPFEPAHTYIGGSKIFLTTREYGGLPE